MRIFLSSCYCCLATALLLITLGGGGGGGVADGFIVSNPISSTANIPSIQPSSGATDASTTRLSASYDYVKSTPVYSNHDGNDNTRSSTSTSSGSRKVNRRRRKIHKDVVIVGGGLAGLSAALYLSQIDPNRQISILDKHDLFDDKGKTSVATFAAAGMLAPQSERLPKGDYLNLCLASKTMYPEFTDLVECMAQEAGDEGAPYLTTNTANPANTANTKDDDSGLEPWNIGYVASGGFLAPAFAGDTVATWAPPSDSKGNAMWLDATQVRELEPSLHQDVVGGWWFPEDASVDARRLAASLRAACVGAGVQLLAGQSYDVSSLDLENGICNGLWLKNGKYISTNTCLVANGAWMRQLLPVPMEPHKGQSLSLRMPKDRPPILRRVLFAADSYIVPKADGRIIIGATVEAGSYDPNVTPSGIMHILSYALQLVPGLADLPLEETWAGLRPTTPDKAPILGKTPWEGLFLAGGYWRNGVLLAPKTGELLAMLMAGEELSPEDAQFLEAFAWDRFTSREGGAEMAANARYAAAMYPVHSRKSGAGVAASVGTELGSYSTAVSAGEERQKDRDALFGLDDTAEDVMEKAAASGIADGAVFSFGGTNYKPPPEDAAINSLSPEEEPMPIPMPMPMPETAAVEAEAPPAKEVNGSTGSTASEPIAVEEGEPTEDLESVYEQIRKNKSMQTMDRNDPSPEERPDPGFRIWHIAEDGTEREVPPYTSPGEFLATIENEVGASSSTTESSTPSPAVSSTKPAGGFLNSIEDETDLGIHTEKVPLRPNEGTPTSAEEIVADPETEGSFDGYQTILEAAASDNDIRKTMRENRMKNRILDDDSSSSYFAKVDEMMSGKAALSDPSKVVVEEEQEQEEEAPAADMLSVYQKIKEQKDAVDFEMNDPSGDERPDPGFRIWHVAADGTERVVPPYTSPGEFLATIENEEGAASAAPTANGDGQHTPVAGSATQETNGQSSMEEYSEKTLDGYETIISANGSSSRDDELAAMREARRSNRLGYDE